MSEPTEQQAGGFLTPEERAIFETCRLVVETQAVATASSDNAAREGFSKIRSTCEAILNRDAEVVCISRETMAVLRVWLDRFTDREAFPSGDPFYEATLALRGALEQTEASSE